MNFYTNVIQWGDTLLVRGIENHKRIMKKVKYRPTLFKTTSQHTGYKTLDGKNVLPKEFDSIKEAKEWYNNRKNQDIKYSI